MKWPTSNACAAAILIQCNKTAGGWSLQSSWVDNTRKTIAEQMRKQTDAKRVQIQAAGNGVSMRLVIVSKILPFNPTKKMNKQEMENDAPANVNRIDNETSQDGNA